MKGKYCDGSGGRSPVIWASSLSVTACCVFPGIEGAESSTFHKSNMYNDRMFGCSEMLRVFPLSFAIHSFIGCGNSVRQACWSWKL